MLSKGAEQNSPNQQWKTTEDWTNAGLTNHRESIIPELVTSGTQIHAQGFCCPLLSSRMAAWGSVLIRRLHAGETTHTQTHA